MTGDERRTRLANERTYLAWWRTGIAALAVSIGAGRLVPALSSGPGWPFTVIGAGFALLGISCSAYAWKRHRELERGLDRDEAPASDRNMALLLSGGATALGLLLLVVLLV